MMVPVFAGTDSPEQIAQLIHYHAPSSDCNGHASNVSGYKATMVPNVRALLALVHVHQVTQGRRAKFNQFFALSRLIALVGTRNPGDRLQRQRDMSMSCTAAWTEQVATPAHQDMLAMRASTPTTTCNGNGVAQNDGTCLCRQTVCKDANQNTISGVASESACNSAGPTVFTQASCVQATSGTCRARSLQIYRNKNANSAKSALENWRVRIDAASVGRCFINLPDVPATSDSYDGNAQRGICLESDNKTSHTSQSSCEASNDRYWISTDVVQTRRNTVHPSVAQFNACFVWGPCDDDNVDSDGGVNGCASCPANLGRTAYGWNWINSDHSGSCVNVFLAGDTSLSTIKNYAVDNGSCSDPTKLTKSSCIGANANWTPLDETNCASSATLWRPTSCKYAPNYPVANLRDQLLPNQTQYQTQASCQSAGASGTALIRHANKAPAKAALNRRQRVVLDSTAADATYGVISVWNTSSITDFSQLFKDKTTYNPTSRWTRRRHRQTTCLRMQPRSAAHRRGTLQASQHVPDVLWGGGLQSAHRRMEHPSHRRGSHVQHCDDIQPEHRRMDHHERDHNAEHVLSGDLIQSAHRDVGRFKRHHNEEHVQWCICLRPAHWELGHIERDRNGWMFQDATSFNQPIGGWNVRPTCMPCSTMRPLSISPSGRGTLRASLQ